MAEILVARARERDARAFEELYRAHHPRIYALALRLTGHRSQAEEVTQETFVQAWQALSSFRGESAFASWLHGIAVRVALRQGRTERRRKARVEENEPALQAAEVRRASPETSLGLEQAVGALPDGARRVLVLHDIEGYRQEEIARLLGIAVGTVKAQLHRARKLVMEALGR